MMKESPAPNPWSLSVPFVRVDAQRVDVPRVDVSVVMPTFNGRAFLQAALSCVSRQTVQVREVIVIDDGSTDGSAELAEECGARVIRRARSGVCAARNVGILEAAGTFVAFLDQDDLWLPTKIERQHAAFERYPNAVMAVTDSAKIDPNDIVLLDSFMHVDFMHYDRTRPTSSIDGIDYFADPDLAMQYTGWFLLPSAVLARRAALLDVGMFDDRIRLNEDVSCFLRVLRKGALVVIDKPLTGWRIHGSNTHRDVLGMHRARLALTQIVLAESCAYPSWFTELLKSEYPGMLAQLSETRGSEAQGCTRDCFGLRLFSARAT
jgi:glycosyltransferase involved in cell wall biosynthesis